MHRRAIIIAVVSCAALAFAVAPASAQVWVENWLVVNNTGEGAGELTFNVNRAIPASAITEVLVQEDIPGCVAQVESTGGVSTQHTINFNPVAANSCVRDGWTVTFRTATVGGRQSFSGGLWAESSGQFIANIDAEDFEANGSPVVFDLPALGTIGVAMLLVVVLGALTVFLVRRSRSAAVPS